MKAVVSIVIAVQLFIAGLWPSAGIGEVCRLGALMEHYEWHLAQEDANLSFPEFLVMHYSDREHQRSDPRHHGKLPFSGHGTTVVAGNIVAVDHDRDMMHWVAVRLTSRLAERDAPEFLCGHLDSIFHPPKG